jgi:hypothetical protein
MKKGITYDENELKDNFKRLEHYLNEISLFYGLIYEQLNGDRSNVEASMVRIDYQKLEKMGEILNSFNISEIKIKSLDSVIKRLEKCRNTPVDY